MKFVIFSAGYNAEKYVKEHMKSIQNQLYKNYIHIIVDDCSQDKTLYEINKYVDDKTIVYKNTVNQKWIPNALKYLPLYLQPDDVVVLVDLDDSLAHNSVLNKIQKSYIKNNCWMTYSLFRYSNGRTSNWIPRYTQEIYEKKLYRNTIWSFGHLRTFKGFLWNALNKEDLKDADGNYFKYCYDRAIFYPMLEMCPVGKVYFIDDVMYNYNDDNVLQVEKIHRKEQEEIRDYLNGKKKYQTLLP